VTPYEQEPFNRLASKASHNSYDQGKGLADQLTFDLRDPAKYGCCGIELDLVQTQDRTEWEVRHVGGWRPPLDAKRRRTDPTKLLSEWLEELRSWSPGTKRRNPVTVILDLKEVHSRSDQLADDLHAYLEGCAFTPDRLFTPAELRGRPPQSPWPSLGEMRDRFVLVLSGSAFQKQAYSKRKDAYCFTDRWVPRDTRDPPDTSNDAGFFINIDCAGMYGQRLDWACKHPALFVRVYNVNSKREWQEVLKRGANMLATDHLAGTDWARVGTDTSACEWRPIKCS
jgi:hypothetical protein